MSGVVLSMGGGGAGAEDEDDVANLLQGDDYDGDGYDDSIFQDLNIFFRQDTHVLDKLLL